ncbi:MAG: serine hydrolase [Caulobacteraceae bacterium]|nr:serine hydrolase [Caulobacteraceae bacterium]
MPLSVSRAATLVLAVCAAAPLGACSTLDHAAHVATGLVSHQLCSATFVSGVDPARFRREALDPTLGPAGSLVRSHVDREHRQVTATLAGLAPSRAVYRGEGYGCLVVRDPPAPPLSPRVHRPAPSLLAPIAGADVVAPANAALAAAVDHEFEEPAHGPHRWTKAVVIVRDGRIIAERYAPGYGIDTPMTGWSMTKSVTNALMGVLVREGRVDMRQPAPISAWSDPADPRHRITPDNLLRMASGLDAGQSLTATATDAFDPTARMVFAERDMAAFAERAPAAGPPGAKWTYSNINTLLLSRIIRDQAGGDAAHVRAFADRELFDKLGMAHVTLEFDAVGDPIGASHMWAPARDWARFGLLYLGDGVVGGERILPEGWVDYSARLTPGSEHFGYGAGFWTNRGDSLAARTRVGAGMPADSFMAQGSYGQVAVVIPSARMVIVRMGMAYTPYGDLAATERLTREAVAAVKGL